MHPLFLKLQILLLCLYFVYVGIFSCFFSSLLLYSSKWPVLAASLFLTLHQLIFSDLADSTFSPLSPARF